MDVASQNGCCDDTDVNGKVDQLLTLLNLPYDHQYLADNACNIVPVLCELVVPDSNRSSDISSVLELLELLPLVCPAKELVIILLEQLDTFKDDELFFALLQPLRMCLQKLPSKKHLSLGLALETLTAHVMTFPAPAEPSDCVLSLPSGFDDSDQRLARAVDALLVFITPFVEEVVQMSASRRGLPSAVRQITDIRRCVLQLLGESLAPVNLSGSDAVKTPCRHSAENCVSLLVRLHPDIIKLIADAAEEKKAIERQQQRNLRLQNRQHAGGDLLANEVEGLYNIEQPLSDTGLAVLLYLVRGEKVCPDSVPQVYRPHYLLEFSLHLVHTLLTVPASAVVHKGIILGSSLFADIGVNSLDGDMFEHDQMIDLVQGLVAVMTSSRVKEVSQSAVRFLRTMLKAFNTTGRSRLLEFLLVSCSNENVQGLAISLLKDELDESLGCADTPSTFLASPSLRHLLSKIFEPVPDGYRSNLLTSLGDRVMSALNLLRYLVIRDPRNQNLTGIWDMLASLEEKFLKPLRTGIVLCRGDVNTEIKRLESGETIPTVNQNGTDGEPCEVEFSIGDEHMPELSRDQQKQAMQSSLISLDMMESVLSRVEQLIGLSH